MLSRGKTSFVIVLSILLLMITVPVVSKKVPKSHSQEHPSVFIAGDSTVQTYDQNWKPRAGWGQMLPNFFSSELTIENHAIRGRSSKSFYEEGRLKKIVRKMKPNDYFLIQFGHNDAKRNRPDLYAPVPEYKKNLSLYVREARQRGGIPILITPVGRRDFNAETGRFNVSFPDYVQGMKEVAKDLDVPLVDLNALSVAYFNTIGPKKTRSIFLYTQPGKYPAFPNGVNDNTHFQEYGAMQIARLLASGIKELDIGLSTYLTNIEVENKVPDN